MKKMKIIINDRQFKVLTEGYSQEKIDLISQEDGKYNTEDEFKEKNPEGFKLYKSIRKRGQIKDFFPNKQESKDEKRINNLVDNVKKLTWEELTSPENNSLYTRYRIAVQKNEIKDLFPNRQELKHKQRIDNLINDVKKLTWEELTNPENSNLYQRYGWSLKKNEIEDLFPNRIKIKSKGEGNVDNILTQIGFDFEQEYIFKDCRSSTINKRTKNFCNALRFDFYIKKTNKNNRIFNNIWGKDMPNNGLIIEFDGEPHFYIGRGGENQLKLNIINDGIKNEYCKDKIKLIRIPYTTKTLTDIEEQIKNALNSPYMFITTGNYPNLGWNSPDLPKPNFHSV